MKTEKIPLLARWFGKIVISRDFDISEDGYNYIKMLRWRKHDYVIKEIFIEWDISPAGIRLML